MPVSRAALASSPGKVDAAAGPAGLWLLLRSTTILPPLAGCIIAVGAVAAQATLTERSLAPPMLGAVLLTTAGTGFVLDDPAAEIASTSPVPLRRRSAARLAVAALVTVAAWLAIAIVAAVDAPAASFPARELGLKVGVLLLVSAAASARARQRHVPGGPVGAGVVVLGSLVLTAFAQRLPRDLPSLMPGSGLPWRWAGLGLAAALALLGATRDPAAPPSQGSARIGPDG